MSHRPAMLGTEVRALIAPVLRECPQECGIVSITNVEVSSDYAYATVSITALDKPHIALEFLTSRMKDLQKRMGGLQIQKTPKLRFKLDHSIAKANRVDELLDRLAKEE